MIYDLTRSFPQTTKVAKMVNFCVSYPFKFESEWIFPELCGVISLMDGIIGHLGMSL